MRHMQTAALECGGWTRHPSIQLYERYPVNRLGDGRSTTPNCFRVGPELNRRGTQTCLTVLAECDIDEGCLTSNIQSLSHVSAKAGFDGRFSRGFGICATWLLLVLTSHWCLEP